MSIELHPHFKKSYKKRIASNPKFVKKTAERLKTFQEDSTNPTLKDHQLAGDKRNYRSFSIAGDIRIVYMKVNDEKVILLDIGSHNQVY